MIEVVSDEFRAGYEKLTVGEQDALYRIVGLLEAKGTALGYPYSSSLKGSLYPLRELRAQWQGRPYRVIYAFDPLRQAVLLIGGDKTGRMGFYRDLIPQAEAIWEQYLEDLGQSTEEELMPTKWRDIRQGKMSATRAARADKHVRETLARMDLRELRRISGKTQAQVAAAMKVSQGQISETEGRADYRLSTLREYVKALGGEIEVFASFGDRKLRLSL